MPRSLRRTGVASLVLCLFVVAGCMRFDYELLVRNDSDTEWIVRAPLEMERGGYAVARVEPGSEGVALAWRGEGDVLIELLDVSCERVDVLKAGPEGQLHAEIAEITATVAPFGTYMSKWNVPGITPTEECGGVVFR